ncbi:MAG TPA: GNAT family N-acetyltransferase [Ktedonobacterales bacterium]|nr:GNAT family N-acetyltransferase [Ktedonobacterales bacterium]
MLHLLSPEHWHLAQPLFDEQHLAVTAAFAGEAPAELYVDDALAPQAGILLLWNHRIYLTGKPTDSAFARGFAALLQERYTPRAAEAEPMECTITYTPGSWEDHLPAQVAGIEAFRAERQQYRLQVHEPLSPPTLPAGFRLRQVDAALVAESTLANHQALLDEMCSEAPSVGDFLQRRFGYCLQYAQELVGWCLSEYNHANRCELGIETLPAFQRRGLAIATASATIAHAHSRGITSVGWHCWKRNIASSSLAQKLGFEKVEDYPVWYCRFGKWRSA